MQDICDDYCQDVLRHEYNFRKRLQFLSFTNIRNNSFVHGMSHKKYFYFNMLLKLLKECVPEGPHVPQAQTTCKTFTSMWEKKIHQVKEKCMELVSPFKSKGNWNDVNCQSHRYPTCHIPPIQEPPGIFGLFWFRLSGYLLV